jgi:hypothetical protein
VKAYWDHDEESLVGTDDLLLFSEQVNRELDGLLAAWGEDAYLKKWNYPFPNEAQSKLRQGIQREKERRSKK